MKNKLIKKIFCILSLITMIFSTIFSSFSQVLATNIGDKVEIVNLGETQKHVKYLFDNGVYGYVQTHVVGYYENGVFRPAYCLEKEKPGVEVALSYDVTIKEAIQNEAVYRVLLKGYPYGGNLGFEDEKDAFFVTKQAIYRVLDGGDVNRYVGADAIGDKMVAKIKELVDYGRNGTETRKNPVIDISTLKTAGVDNLDKNYISQVFKVDSEINSKDIRIYMNTEQAPAGSKLTDLNNNQKTTFQKGEQFKVLIPRKNITKAVSIDITATGNVETFPVFFSESPNEAWQDYALVTDPFVFTTTSAKMTYTEPKGTIEVEKISKEYNKYTGLAAGSGLKGAIFEIQRIDGGETYKKQFTTDDLGKIIKELKLGTYRLTELIPAGYYQIGKEGAEHEFTLEYDGQKIVIKVENDVVNLKIDVEKSGTVESKPGEEIEYNFDIQNKSDDEVSNFIWGDILPSEVRIKKLYTGTFNQENSYKVQYITNNNTNWKTVGTYNTTTNNEMILDSKTLGLADGEYVEEIRFVFENKVEKGFKNNGTKIIVTANEDLKNNQIIENHTYLTADYLEVDLIDKDEFHTIIRTPEKTTLTGVLPRTGK